MNEEMQSANKAPKELKDALIRSIIREQVIQAGVDPDEVCIDDETIEEIQAQLPEGLLDRACEELSDYAEENVLPIIAEMEHEKKTMNTEGYKTLLAVYALLSVLCSKGNKPKCEIHRAFNSGGVTFTEPAIELDREGIFVLGRALRNCSTFEVYPKLDGTVSIGVTVENVLSSAE
ncbi:MAG: hypothetical protein LUE21_09230 [Oscillospiraceae bacterium]|nr:hypothetical protein [Oscillospiraceae bacterium]